MSVDTYAETREIRSVVGRDPTLIFSSKSLGSLVEMGNDRGRFEVLLSPEKADDYLSPILADQEVQITGYWRRRSGRRADGSRKFIWCLVVLHVADAQSALKAA